MRRNDSFNSVGSFGGGGYGPTIIIDRCLSSHMLAARREESTEQDSPTMISTNFSSNGSLQQYKSYVNDYIRTIRFQVVVWYVGAVDVMQGQVVAKFRVSMFWNDDGGGNERRNRMTKLESSEWVMQGRQKAVEQKISDEISERTVDIPPLSILNAVSFDIIGKPEVKLLREKTKLMRWTCLYKAVLFQDETNMRVEKFPHDEHDLCIKLGILAHRGQGSRWDRNKWRLALATEEDSQRSTRVPHGLLVDHVKIPNFNHDSQNALNFQFVPLGFGSSKEDDSDECLEVKVHIYRESNYFDWNIMPMLATLDVVATALLLLDATSFFQRALLFLNITFVEIGIRMQLDSKLPNVGYQIKMQTILNNSFFRLLGLELESSMVYYLTHIRGWSVEHADIIDMIAASISLVHAIFMLHVYYKDKRPPMKRTSAPKQVGKPITCSPQMYGTPTTATPLLLPLNRQGTSQNGTLDQP
mmetsp:Transcript_14686/g.21692  ORF Transcript_14686/g.21692 Transcript_14686/m.21692 type:complete len:471 (-) Transcript_14686:382-1794(-)